MGTELGKNLARLIEELKEYAPDYNVFQAIYIAETIRNIRFPERRDDIFDHKGLHFRPYEYYQYPPTDIREFSYTDDEMNFVLTFMGLYGIDSPLPRSYHEQVAIQQSVHGPGNVQLQNFMDIFNNRFYWLYYQAWKKYRYFLQLGEDLRSRYVQRVFCFAGLGPRLEKTNSQISLFNLFRLSGVLSLRIRNKSGLQIILAEFFPGVKSMVTEFVANKVPLAEILHLGKSQISLGENSVLGRSVIDYQSKICIRIGPLSFTDYLNFLPGEPKAILLQKIIDLYLNDTIEYDVEFLIDSDTITSIPWNDKRLKLGQSIWLGHPRQKIISRYYDYTRMSKVA